jgi:hypothetical protein
MASHAIDFDSAPSVNPTGGSTPAMRIDANADQFGGAIARSLGSVGQGLEKAGQVGFDLVQQQSIYDSKTHAAELHSWQSDQVTDAQEQFLQLRGKAALEALPDFKKKIYDINSQTRSQAGNQFTSQIVDAEGRRLTDTAYAGAARHAASQRSTWEATTAANSSESYGDSAHLAAVQSPAQNVADDPIVSDRLFKSDQERRNFFSSQGYDGDALEQQVSKNRGKNVNQIVTSLTSDGSQSGLKRAIDFFHNQYDQIDPATRVTIENKLKTQSASYDGRTAADTFMGRAQNVPAGYINRTFQIESGGNAAATTGKYKGLGQFSPEMEARYGINDTNRADPNAQSRALSLENQDNHDALTKALGHEPTPADYYLAHQQGIGGAVAHLSQPDLPAWKNMASTLEGRSKGDGWAKQAIWGNLTPQMKEQFPGGVDTVTSGDFARMWAQRFNNQPIQANGIGPDGNPVTKFSGAQVLTTESKASVLTQIQNDPYLIDHPQAMKAAIEHANKVFEAQNATYIDQERMIKVQNEQRKVVSDDTENTYLKDIYSPQPKASVTSIVNDDRLSPEAKRRLINIAGDPGQKDSKTYGAGFEQAFADIHAPPGNPDRITDPNQLYNRLGRNADPAKQLTMAGVEKLREEIERRKSPEGTAESEMKKQFLSNAKGQISGSNEGLHIKDPKGDELYLKFLAQAWPSYDKGRKDGKSPEQLLNPDSADYVGKIIPTFKRPMNQWFSDVIQDQPTVAPGAGFDVKSIKTLDDAVKAYRGGKITKPQAEELAIQNGWAQRRAQAAPLIPMSQ